MFTDVGVETETTQGPHQRPTVGARRAGSKSESKNGSTENPGTRRRTRARSWDRSSRSGSISEGHQSPEDEGESKKKVDWCDPQWKGPVSPAGADGIATIENGHGSQRYMEAGSPSCVSPFIYPVRLRVIESSSLSNAEVLAQTTEDRPFCMATLLHRFHQEGSGQHHQEAQRHTGGQGGWAGIREPQRC